jgi:DNA-binding MarR family transcriptional regulator
VADRDALITRIMETQRQLRRRFSEENIHPLLDVNVTMSQLKILILLARLGGTSGQELARRTGVSLGTLTGIIDRLVAQGMVTRREDPRDRRVRRLELTPEGSKLINGLIAAGEAHQEQLLRRLDDAGLEIVVQAFTLLLDIAAQPDPAAENPEPR